MGHKHSKGKAKWHTNAPEGVGLGSSKTPRKPTRTNRRQDLATDELGAALLTPAILSLSLSMQRNAGYPSKGLASEPSLEKVQEQDVSPSTTSSVSAPFQFMPLTEDDIIVSRSDNTPANLTSQEVATSMTGFLDENSEPSCSSACHHQEKAEMVDVKTSTPKITPCFCPDTIFYHMNQHVGSETRHAEFKKGGVIFDQRAFRTLLGRYLCAFLNTEGGIIYFGVTDDGKVVGISINQKTEDELRLSIDNVVSSILPHVPTSAYAINFANIMGNNGEFKRDMKVMEICVHPRNPPRALHSFDGNTYVRRDGSLRTI